MNAEAVAASCPDADAIVAFAEGALRPAQRERVVAHLDRCRACLDAVHQAALGLGTATEAATATVDADGWPAGVTRGTPLHRYIVIEPLGAGGLGEVYVAYDPDLDRKVAVKLLKHAGADEQLERRLIREGRALAKVSHPNVVHVYDVGTVDGRRFGARAISPAADPAAAVPVVFIAMELVEGVTFSAWLRTAQRRWSEIRDVMLGAAAGVSAAHRAGLVHRDFKPSNVLVDVHGRARVLDFGLARRVALRVGDHPSVAYGSGAPLDDGYTQPGMLAGTPAYMAPEQFDGGPIDARADQFSFCVTLFEALYGRRPFRGDSPLAVLEAIKLGRIAEPLRDTRPPQWLRRAVVRGLAFDPAQRHLDMHALEHALAHDRRGWRRPWVAIATAAALSSAVMWSVGELTRPETIHDDVVERLVDDARGAAAKSYFVYPPATHSDHPTAYRAVVQLEALGERGDREAVAQAELLRSELADTLVRLGDRYWEHAGGRAFAIDYYAQALLFAPDDARAGERATLTQGELAALRDKAGSAGFTASELAAAESLAVLAEPDDDARKVRLAELYASERAPGLTTTNRLEDVLGSDVTEAVRGARAPARTRAPRASSTPPRSAAAAAPPSEPAAEIDAPKPAVISTPSAREAPQRSISERLATAKAAARKGRFAEAERELEAVLAIDGDHAAAAVALAEIHFDRGHYVAAGEYAARAVGAAPSNAGHRLLLGDCHFRNRKLDDARAQYQAALDLGDRRALVRLRRLEEREGG